MFNIHISSIVDSSVNGKAGVQHLLVIYTVYGIIPVRQGVFCLLEFTVTFILYRRKAAIMYVQLYDALF